MMLDTFLFLYLLTQIAATMNRVVENLRSHLDAVVIHIGSHELTDAAHSIGPATSRDSVASVAGSVATVASRQVRRSKPSGNLSNFRIF